MTTISITFKASKTTLTSIFFQDLRVQFLLTELESHLLFGRNAKITVLHNNMLTENLVFAN